jgi:hypothetical protein
MAERLAPLRTTQVARVQSRPDLLYYGKVAFYLVLRFLGHVASTACSFNKFCSSKNEVVPASLGLHGSSLTKGFIYDYGIVIPQNKRCKKNQRRNPQCTYFINL